MAILNDSRLSFELIFKSVDECLWIQYEAFFRWDEQYVFRDELLKRDPSGWAGRTEGALCANEFDCDSFLPVLKQAIDALEPICWEPTEPDIMIAFYPDQQFPLIPSRTKEIYDANRLLKQREERNQQKIANKGRLPDDVVTMIIFVDAYNFKGCSPYYGTGFAMIMAPTRAELAMFHKQLRYEYDAFVTRERLPERIAERDARLKDELDQLED